MAHTIPLTFSRGCLLEVCSAYFNPSTISCQKRASFLIAHQGGNEAEDSLHAITAMSLK